MYGWEPSFELNSEATPTPVWINRGLFLEENTLVLHSTQLCLVLINVDHLHLDDKTVRFSHREFMGGNLLFN